MEESIKALMKEFGRAFFRADPELLRAATTPDFVWHLHTGTATEGPSGRTVRGVAETMAVIRWRKQHWSEVRYTDVVEECFGNRVVQTFRVSGIDQHGVRFDVRAVDLYLLAGGKVASKDSYWKRITS